VADRPEGLSDADKKILEDEGYEPGADFGEGEEELGRAQGRARQSEDIPGWEENLGGNDHSSGSAEREAGKDARVVGRRSQGQTITGGGVRIAAAQPRVGVQPPTHPWGRHPNASAILSFTPFEKNLGSQKLPGSEAISASLDVTKIFSSGASKTVSEIILLLKQTVGHQRRLPEAKKAGHNVQHYQRLTRASHLTA
jgi:hypothetical protein